MRLSLIVAVSENNVIGRGGQLPWRLSMDLRRFKRLTMGHHILLGRRTLESIGRPLPGRIMVVLSRNPAYTAEGVTVATDLDQALLKVSGDDEIFIIGGAEVYRWTLHRVSRMYVTTVHAQVNGDTFFPEVNWDEWTLLEDIRFPADEKNDYDYSFRVYDRTRRRG